MHDTRRHHAVVQRRNPLLAVIQHAEHFLPVWAEWTRRLEVGSFLREGSLSSYRKGKTKLFRDRLELLKHAVEEGDREESREYVATVSRAYGRMRGAFLDHR